MPPTLPKLLQLKVTLFGIEPKIWRRVVIPDTATLVELHVVLQGAMGWQDCHLHYFEIEGQKYEVPEIDEYGPEEGFKDERSIILRKALKGISEFSYVYDFGDRWRHLVEVENVRPLMPRRFHWPICIDGENACPPEDCGGWEGYTELKEALADKTHPEHAPNIDWCGSFNPDAFNPIQATLLIHAQCALYKERGWGFDGE